MLSYASIAPLYPRIFQVSITGRSVTSWHCELENVISFVPVLVLEKKPEESRAVRFTLKPLVQLQDTVCGVPVYASKRVYVAETSMFPWKYTGPT